MQASKQLEVEFLDPLCEPEKVMANDGGAFDPQELQCRKGKRHAHTKVLRVFLLT